MEAITDIVREMRRNVEWLNAMGDQATPKRDVAALLGAIADRIEAATAQNHGNCVEAANPAETPANTPVSPQRDFAVLREAVGKIAGYSKDLVEILRHEKGEGFALGVRCEAENASAALERIARNEAC